MSSGQEAPRRAPYRPSVHVRAILTWLAIFPLVFIGMLALGPFWADWPPVLHALTLTVIVVPAAVYVVVPQLHRAHESSVSRLSRHRNKRGPSLRKPEH